MAEEYFIKNVFIHGQFVYAAYIGKVGQILYFTTNRNNLEFIIIRTDINVNILSVNSITVDNFAGSGIITDMTSSNGELVFSGKYTENEKKLFYIFAFKIDSSNNLLWFKTYTYTNFRPIERALIKKVNSNTMIIWTRPGKDLLFTINKDGIVLNSFRNDSKTFSIDSLFVYKDKNCSMRSRK